jgi:hypothetical protein
VKATGDGILRGLTQVLMGQPGEPPRLTSYCGHANVPVWLADLTANPSRLAAVAVLTSGCVILDEVVITRSKR